MADPSSGSSPPKGLSSSPSIFAYQARLLERTSSVSKLNNGGHHHRSTPSKSSISSISHSPGLNSLSSLANSGIAATGSPPSTPIRRNVARMAAGWESSQPNEAPASPSKGSSSATPIGLGLGMAGRKNHRAAGSVDLWESRISKANAGPEEPTAIHLKRSSLFNPSPAARTSSTVTSDAEPLTPSSTAASSPYMSPDAVDGTGALAGQQPQQSKPSWSASPALVPADQSAEEERDTAGETVKAPRARPGSTSSYTSVLSPNSTGNSSAASGRSQSVEDTLAAARANALRRLEARKKARGETGDAAAASPALPGAAQPIPMIATALASVNDATPKSTPVKSALATGPSAPTASGTAPKTTKLSPFGDLFSPPTAFKDSSSESTPVKAASLSVKDIAPAGSTPRANLRPVAASPSTTPIAGRYTPSGLSNGGTPVAPSPMPSASGSSKYGSLSSTDRRRLGRHLPRIASGGEGWDEEAPPTIKDPSTRRRPSGLAQSVEPPAETPKASSPAPAVPPSPRPAPYTPSTDRFLARKKSVEVLASSQMGNKSVIPSAPSTPVSVAKRRSAFMSTPSKGDLGGLANSPRPEVAGEEMKGLMNAVGNLAVRGNTGDTGEGVTGMSSRLRLSRATLPPSASSSTVAPAPLPSRRLMQTNWMDRQRHALAAYEYLCHVGEAQQWIEGCLDEELGFGVTELEEGLRDGVVLAKLARKFQGEQVVKTIWTESKHRYKQTDNINHFLKFIRSVGMPETFTFDVTDLYNARNIPKVIFGIHVLSHLLARLGRAERIGNLVGHFDFTDEQLAATQKGIQGKALPNFGDARGTLAKEASWEPEEPEETEDERRDRELLECEGSIIALQKHLRGRLARARTLRLKAQLELAEPIVARFQARARGAMSRSALKKDYEQRLKLHSWATALQAAARRSLAQQHQQATIETSRRAGTSIITLQAQIRGVLARNRAGAAETAFERASKNIVALQARCRGCLARRARKAQAAQCAQPEVAQSVTSLQAILRGRLQRQAQAQQIARVRAEQATFTRLQSQLRGALVRRKRQAEEQKMDDATDHIVAIQAVCRGVLARKKKQAFAQSCQAIIAPVTSLQTLARARLARQHHQMVQKALAKVEVAISVGGFQALLRTKLARRQATEQKKKLEFVQPDVVGFQAAARGYLARREYQDWRDYLHDPHTQGALVFLQSLIRGFNARRRLYIRMRYLHANVRQIVKVQALWRGRVQRRMYDRLITGEDVDVPTVQNYMHLLNDTESDFTDQIRTESLRKEVIALICENQALETEVEELSTKIGLIAKNMMTFQELAKAKKRLGNGAARGDDAAAFGAWGSNDPFGGNPSDRTSQRKLELFEHLFFTLQTKPDYLARLIRAMAKPAPAGAEDELDQERKLVEQVALLLFGFGHERREEYLFHKLLQLSVHMEVLVSASLDSLVEARLPIIPLASQYIKSTLSPWLADVVGGHVCRIIEIPELDLCTDPVEVYLRLINEEESQTGAVSKKPRDLNSDQVLQVDGVARADYIRHLQDLRYLTDQVLKNLYVATAGLPYSVRYLARETLLALRVKYPDALDEDLTPIVAKTAILPFLLPGLVAPESFSIVPQAVGPAERKNLAAIATLIGYIATPDSPPSATNPKERFVKVPLQEYIKKEADAFRDWILEVASVEPLESYFEAHELFDATMEAKPIMITRTEIYGMLSILMKNVPVITGNKPKDSIAAVLAELEGPPIEYDRGKTTVSLRLTNRLADLQHTGPDAQVKEIWVQAKRHVLAVLRVQTGRTLYDVLVSRPEAVDEQRWIEEVHSDIALENVRRAKHGLPPTPVEAGYQIESIRSLPFHEVKSRAIEFCIQLERLGRLTRKDHFQGLLNSIALDIRQKHHLRKMQRQTLAAMIRAHEDMTEKKRGFVEQIESYHTFIDSSMANLQKGKKKPIFLSKQYMHQRHEAKIGKKAQFGSYKYTAEQLHERGILLGISNCSPRQYDKISLVLASNEVGVFSIEISAPQAVSATLSGREEVRMEDLLQAQFDNELNLLLFEGAATFSINMLIHQINKKFYAS